MSGQRLHEGALWRRGRPPYASRGEPRPRLAHHRHRARTCPSAPPAARANGRVAPAPATAQRARATPAAAPARVPIPPALPQPAAGRLDQPHADAARDRPPTRLQPHARARPPRPAAAASSRDARRRLPRRASARTPRAAQHPPRGLAQPTPQPCGEPGPAAPFPSLPHPLASDPRAAAAAHQGLARLPACAPHDAHHLPHPCRAPRDLLAALQAAHVLTTLPPPPAGHRAPRRSKDFWGHYEPVEARCRPREPPPAPHAPPAASRPPERPPRPPAPPSRPPSRPPSLTHPAGVTSPRRPWRCSCCGALAPLPPPPPACSARPTCSAPPLVAHRAAGAALGGSHRALTHPSPGPRTQVWPPRAIL